MHLQPGAGKSRIDGLHGDALKIRVQAPPVEGKANAALIELLAGRLGVARRSITLIAGERSREKRVAIAADHVDPLALLQAK